MKVILDNWEIVRVLVEHLNKKFAPCGLRTNYQVLSIKYEHGTFIVEAEIIEKEDKKRNKYRT